MPKLAAKQGTEARHGENGVAISGSINAAILTELCYAGRFREAITLYESLPRHQREGFAQTIVGCYLCAGEDNKANAIVKEQLQEEINDLNTIAFIADNVAAHGQFDKALAFFAKWDKKSDMSLRSGRIDAMRYSVVRYHLRKGDARQALANARQIVSKSREWSDLKMNAYYEIIEKLIRQEAHEKKRPASGSAVPMKTETPAEAVGVGKAGAMPRLACACCKPLA